MKRNQTNDSVWFAFNFLLTLALGAVVAFGVTYGASLIFLMFGPLPEDWESFASLFTGTVFGLVVGYRLCTMSHKR